LGLRRLRLAAGQTLDDALLGAYRQATKTAHHGDQRRDDGKSARVGGAVGTLLSGAWERLTFCTGVPDPTGIRVANYAAPECARDCLVIGGSFTIGRGLSSEMLIHCHATFVDTAGALFGGHLIPEQCRIGKQCVGALATLISGFEIAQCDDPETNHQVFQPVSLHGGEEGKEMPSNSKKTMAPGLAPSAGATSSRLFYARIRPNEDFARGVEKICLAEGIHHAVVRGSLGSLTDACLEVAGEKHIELRGPAIEVLMMTGEVRSDEAGIPTATLAAVVADSKGRIFAGRIVPGRNPVCVTFELALESCAAN